MSRKEVSDTSAEQHKEEEYIEEEDSDFDPNSEWVFCFFD